MILVKGCGFECNNQLGYTHPFSCTLCNVLIGWYCWWQFTEYDNMCTGEQELFMTVPHPHLPFLNWGPIVETPCCIKVYSQYQSLPLSSIHIVISIALKVCRLQSFISVLPIELYLITNTAKLYVNTLEHYGSDQVVLNPKKSDINLL